MRAGDVQQHLAIRMRIREVCAALGDADIQTGHGLRLTRREGPRSGRDTRFAFAIARLPAVGGPGVPSGTTPGTDEFHDYLKEEYRHVAEAHFRTIEAISAFFRHYLLIVSVPLTLVVLFTGLASRSDELNVWCEIQSGHQSNKVANSNG